MGDFVKNLIVGTLRGIAEIVPMAREAFGKTVEEIGKEIRAGKLIANEAFERSKVDENTLDDLYKRRGG